MARANRLSGHGGIFHVTHRCHNREFLLKFALDRDGYRARLRERLPQFAVALLDYCITSNHVHLLLDAEERMQISGLMRTVAGEFARAYNRRKERMNAFWGDNFHATLVEEGTYLWRCVCYIELNMVRCRRVAHPREWDWLGYHEIMGQRQRYRVLDLDRLCWRLQADSLVDVRDNLQAALGEQIAQEEVKREPCWTEGLAVGSAGFLERIRPLILSRQETELVQQDREIWVLQEAPIPYGAKTGSKNAPKNLSFFIVWRPNYTERANSNRAGLHTLKKLLELNPATRREVPLGFDRGFCRWQGRQAMFGADGLAVRPVAIEGR